MEIFQGMTAIAILFQIGQYKQQLALHLDQKVQRESKLPEAYCMKRNTASQIGKTTKR